jgi:hypothetical protein
MATPASISKNSYDTKFWIGYPTVSPTSYPGKFFQLLVEEYNTFGTEVMMASSEPIDDTRSERSGQISFKKSSMEIKTELRHYNLQKEIASVLFATLNLNATTDPIDENFAKTPITAMVTASGTTTFTASGGGFTTGQTNVAKRFKVRDWVKLTGCPTESNNKLIVITNTPTNTTIATTMSLVDDDPSSGEIKAEVVGHRFESGALNLTYASGVLTLTNVDSSVTDPLFTEMGFERGQWIFIGGDIEDERFAPAVSNYGYARIKTISATALTFDLTSWPPETSVGTGKTISIFFGTFVKNRSGYNGMVKSYKAGILQLGHDANGIMSKVLFGMVSDEMKFTFPTPGDNSKITVDTKMVAISSDDRTGSQGLPSGGITYVNAPDDQMYTTSGGDNKKFVMYKRTTAVTNPTASFAYVIEGDLTIGNSADVLPAIGYSEGYDVKYGILKVEGSLTCAFLNNEQGSDIISNNKYGLYGRWNRTFNRYNEGLIIDMPKIDVTTEGVTPKKDDEMMIQLDIKPKRDDDLNAVISFTFFNALPNVALI